VSRIAADTSFLRALLVEEEPGHDEAVRLASCVSEIVVPSVAIHELVWSLRRSHGAVRAQSLVAYVLGSEVFLYEPVTREDVWFALRDPRRYEDLLVLHTALRLGLGLATLDKELARLARRLGVEIHRCE